MHEAKLEHDGNDAVLKLTTHFGDPVSIKCSKTDAQSFRLSFTGANEILVGCGLAKEVYDSVVVVEIQGREFRAERLSEDEFVVGQPVFVTEYYGLYMERDKPSFVASLQPIQEPRLLFVNVDLLDGGGNLMKRYRVSPYNGSYRIVSDD